MAALAQDAPELLTPGVVDVLAWDPNLGVTSGRQPVENNGCPDGYFAQFVGIGEPAAVAVPGKAYALRCRLIATSTPTSIVHESGVTLREAETILTGAVADTYRQLKQEV